MYTSSSLISLAAVTTAAHGKQQSHHARQHHPPVAVRVPSVSGERAALAVTTSFGRWKLAAACDDHQIDLVAAPVVLPVVASSAQTHNTTHSLPYYCTYTPAASCNQPVSPPRHPPPAQPHHIAYRAAASSTQDTSAHPQPTSCAWKLRVAAGNKGTLEEGTTLARCCATLPWNPREHA